MAIIDLGKVSITWKGAYAGGTAYTPKDAVVYNNASYICIANTTGNLPTDTTYWNVMAAKGVDGTDLTSTLTTQGDVVYRDGSGLARLAKGSAADVLTMNAGATAPEWAASAGGGGAWEYICRQTLASDASDIQFIDGTAATDGTPDFGSDYAAVQFLMEHFTPATDAAQARLWISTDTGSSYLTADYWAASQWIKNQADGQSTTVLGATDNFRLSTTTEGDAAQGLNGYVNLFNTSDTAHNPFATWDFATSESGINIYRYSGGAFHTTDQNVDAVKFGFNTGDVLAASTIRMYGLKAS